MVGKLKRYFRKWCRTDYIYKLDDPLVIDLRAFAKWLPDTRNEWFSLIGGILTIHEQYAWNGCSPRIKLFNRWSIGAWNGPEECLKIPSCAHDLLYQYTPCKKWVADLIFLYLAFVHSTPIVLAVAYYNAVVVFGGIAGKSKWGNGSKKVFNS
jgi:hypothetical protein